MPITETRTHTRPSTTTTLWSDSTGPALSAAMTAIQPYRDSGALILARTLSDDQLTITQTLTYRDLETYSAVDTIFGIALNAEAVNYATANGITNGDYQQTGIDQLFTCITTYRFSPTATMPNGQSISEFLLATIPRPRLTDIQVNADSVVATFQFGNSADYLTNSWIDVPYCVDLHAAGVTRSYNYSLVTGA